MERGAVKKWRILACEKFPAEAFHQFQDTPRAAAPPPPLTKGEFFAARKPFDWRLADEHGAESGRTPEVQNAEQEHL